METISTSSAKSLGIFLSNFLTVENISQISTIAVAVAAIVAIIKFFVDKKRQQNLSVVEQLSFFRIDILDQFESIVKDILLKNPKHDFKLQRIKGIKDFSYSWIYLTHKNTVLVQGSLEKDKELKENIIKLMNSLEQFSWSVILHKTSMHPALRVVHDSYVQFIEQFSHQLLFLRAVNPKQFEGIKKIYNKWEPLILRETEEESLERITKEARERWRKDSCTRKIIE